MRFPDGQEIKEQERSYRIPMGVSMLNEQLALMPQSYQQLFATLAEQHLDFFLCSMPYLLPHGLNWVIMSMHVEVDEPLTNTHWLTAKTWMSARKGPYYRREFCFMDEAGTRRFHGTTFNILLDMEKRSVFRGRELPFPIDPPTPEFLIDPEGPHFKENLPFETVATRRAENSDIDAVGHVNNCRYGAFAYDLFREEEKAILKGPLHIDYYFINELQPQKDFQLQRFASPEGDRLVFRGCTEGQPAFVVQFRK